MTVPKDLNLLNFDANACFGVPLELQPLLRTEPFLNPSSVHRGGQRARAMIEETREHLCALLKLATSDYRVVFTSGASEANNIIIHSMAQRFSGDTTRALVCAATEHPSVLTATVGYAARHALKTIYVKPDTHTLQYSFAQVAAALEGNDEPVLACFMRANNETGRMYDLKDLFLDLRNHFPNVWLHVDAVQGPGKIENCLNELDFDSAAISGHKFGALSGVGACLVKRSRLDEIMSSILGGPQEFGVRAGTENCLGIFSLSLAIKWLMANQTEILERYRSAKLALRKKLSLSGVRYSSSTHDLESLPNTLSLQIDGVTADDCVVALDLQGILCSAGSACLSGKPSPSHVLLAEGLSEVEARSTLRISFSAVHTYKEIEEGISRTSEILRLVQQKSMITPSQNQFHLSSPSSTGVSS
jgi:cysteine desulfurase